MSLINDALKKAQSMQPAGQNGGLKLGSKAPAAALATATAPTPPIPGSAPAVAAGDNRPSPPKKPPAARPGMILAIAGAVFLATVCMVVVAGMMLWNGGSGEPSFLANSSTPRVRPPDEKPPVVVPAPVTAPPETAVVAKPPPVEIAAPKTVVVAPAPNPPAVSEPPAVDLIVEAEEEREPEHPRIPTRPKDPKLQAYVLTIRVAGIRTGVNAKALMNDRVYSIGEYISPNHDLRLSRVQERAIDLEDSAGNTYEVRF